MAEEHLQHRKRTKERFLKGGLDSFPDHNKLELLLMFGLPQGDVNPLAHRLIQEFGSLSGVLDASYDDLLRVDGVGPHVATLLKLIPAFCRAYLDDKNKEGVLLDSAEKIVQFMVPKFAGVTCEMLYLLCLDNKNRLIKCSCMGSGDMDSISVSTRKIAEEAFHTQATAVILCHNHPKGIAMPSDQDISMTQRIAQALHPLRIRLLDHIVIAGEDGVSMMDSGWLLSF